MAPKCCICVSVIPMNYPKYIYIYIMPHHNDLVKLCFNHIQKYNMIIYYM